MGRLGPCVFPIAAQGSVFCIHSSAAVTGAQPQSKRGCQLNQQLQRWPDPHACQHDSGLAAWLYHVVSELWAAEVFWSPKSWQVHCSEAACSWIGLDVSFACQALPRYLTTALVESLRSTLQTGICKACKRSSVQGASQIAYSFRKQTTVHTVDNYERNHSSLIPWLAHWLWPMAKDVALSAASRHQPTRAKWRRPTQGDPQVSVVASSGPGAPGLRVARGQLRDHCLLSDFVTEDQIVRVSL